MHLEANKVGGITSHDNKTLKHKMTRCGFKRSIQNVQSITSANMDQHFYDIMLHVNSENNLRLKVQYLRNVHLVAETSLRLLAF